MGLTRHHTVLRICLARPGSARALVGRRTFAKDPSRLAFAAHSVLVIPVGGRNDSLWPHRPSCSCRCQWQSCTAILASLLSSDSRYEYLVMSGSSLWSSSAATNCSQKEVHIVTSPLKHGSSNFGSFASTAFPDPFDITDTSLSSFSALTCEASSWAACTRGTRTLSRKAAALLISLSISPMSISISTAVWVSSSRFIRISNSEQLHHSVR